MHVQVGAFHLDDPLLDGVWARLEDSGTPIVVHAGSGPVPNDFTGPAPLERVLARWPRLAVVVAHLGAPEYEEFLTLAERFERVHLDTTMVFTDFFEEMSTYPRSLLPRLADLRDKVLLGSDFPTIPYPYLHQLEALERPRPGGTLAACRVLGQRCATIRNERSRHSPLGWGYNSRGADRFRLGTFVPGEAGRGASVIS